MTPATSRATRAALAATAIFISSAALAAGPQLGPCEREMARAAQAENIPLAVLYSVGLTETGARGLLQPYAMNIDGEAVVSASLPEAIAKFNAAQARGAKFIDIGCMQINQRFHGKNFVSLAAMFDQRLNVSYAARFLKQLRARETSWTLAVARYNAGPDNNYAQKKYVCAVIGNMVRSGFGAWTDNARRFCGQGGA
jgi:soluble lytic murein transglycosylase-like protein